MLQSKDKTTIEVWNRYTDIPIIDSSLEGAEDIY